MFTVVCLFYWFGGFYFWFKGFGLRFVFRWLDGLCWFDYFVIRILTFVIGLYYLCFCYWRTWFCYIDGFVWFAVCGLVCLCLFCFTYDFAGSTGFCFVDDLFFSYTDCIWCLSCYLSCLCWFVILVFVCLFVVCFEIWFAIFACDFSVCIDVVVLLIWIWFERKRCFCLIWLDLF